MNKKTIVLIAIILYIASAAGSFAYFSKNPVSLTSGPETEYKTPVASNGTATEEIEETGTEECPINGRLFSKENRDKWEKRRPLGIMVENSKAARPQSGINSADVTYEAVAEGGITRFLNIFYCQDAKYVGPVRSARIYFIRLLQEYGEYPLYAHVGGANKDGIADALGEIKKLDWFAYSDMDPLYGMSFPYFWRDYERLPNRDTEHTVYTNTEKLWDFAETKRKLTNVDEEGTPWDKDFKKWTFKNDASASERGDVAKVSFGFWDQFASDYSVTWNYDKKTNKYLRENGGEKHIDKNTGKPLEAKNIVIILADESAVNDGYEAGQHLFYDIVGDGTGFIFQDGKVIKMNWEKKDGYSRMMFTDAAGKEISLVRGKIFVEILPLENKVTY